MLSSQLPLPILAEEDLQEVSSLPSTRVGSGMIQLEARALCWGGGEGVMTEEGHEGAAMSSHARDKPICVIWAGASGARAGKESVAFRGNGSGTFSVWDLGRQACGEKCVLSDIANFVRSHGLRASDNYAPNIAVGILNMRSNVLFKLW